MTGMTGKFDGYYMGEAYQERLSKITDKTAARAFQEAYAKKMAGSTDYISTISKAFNTGKVSALNFEDAFPRYDVITHVGNADISSANWQRNDFPFWKYFDPNTSADALNDWRPEGANPPQTQSGLQIMAKLQEWKEDYDRWDNTVAASYGYNVAEHQASKSYVFDLDENGDVRNCTVTSQERSLAPQGKSRSRLKQSRKKDAKDMSSTYRF